MASNLTLFNQTITNPKTQKYLDEVLKEKSKSFVNNITALVANNKALQECEPLTLMYACVKATALDLPFDPNLGFAYVIPYKNNKEGTTQAQFQLGYKAFVQLALRSGQFKNLNVRDVREGEIVGEDFVSGEIQFKALSSDKRMAAPIIGYVGYFKLVNGFEKMSYWTIQEVEAHAKRYSQTYASKNDYVQKSSKWATDFDAMAKKTVLKLLLSKYAPLSIDMQQAVKFDQSVIVDEQETAVYVDNEQPTAEETAHEQINSNRGVEQMTIEDFEKGI